MTLFAHQQTGIAFLVKRKSAMLCDEMGLGKTRQALCAALELYRAKKIDRVLVLAPAAVRYSWREEVVKLSDFSLTWLKYKQDKQVFLREDGASGEPFALLISVVSYALLPQKRHVEALRKWCEDGKTLLVADESSFLKNRTAKQTRGAASIASACAYRWLLTGTPIANSPLDLYGQAMVMFPNGAQ